MKMTGFTLVKTGAKQAQLWTPAKITTALWFDASDASTITLVGSNVSQWNDKSGNNRHASQAVAGNRPTFASNKITCLTGKSLVLASRLSIPNNFTIIMACANANDSSGQLFTALDSSESTSQSTFNLKMFYYSGWPGFATTLSGLQMPNLTNTHWYGNGLLTQRRNGSAGLFSLNSFSKSIALGGTVNIDNACGNRQTNIGSNHSVSEIVVCSSALSDSDLEKVQGYLAYKWNMQNLLPANHPYKNAPYYE